ncbi:FUSC family protein [Sphingobium cloacae]|uniref:Fusaric acid resistance protein n=1 Tax=Sphingobium cloacae TaxID=120107 RepID=A0A1E1F465_9SPHN|nr:FUSC family protein [Sphingobium cloacae]BAV65314.1 fusaric acid resistance protein [Sphingobium cloacae]
MIPPYFSFPRWLFAVKLFLAGMIAFAIAVHIGLPQPYWALVTCCVVMNPITGAIRSKAIYRFMGTLGAGVVSLILAAVFVNTPLLLVGVMGLAATATLAVSLIDRTPRSYGFLLFGVTMMLVAVPEIDKPGNMFGTAVARITEIGLGIICCTMIDSLIMPRSLGPQMRERLHAWLPDVQRWFEEALQGREADPEATADRLRMIGDVTALSVLAGQLRYDPMVPRRERRLAFAIQQRMLRLIPLISGIEARISGGDAAQREALSQSFAEAAGLVRDGEAPPGDFTARMNAADDGAPGSWRRLVQRDLAVLIADALALWAEIRNLDAALAAGTPLPPALEASARRVRAFPLRPDYPIVWRVSAAILLTYGSLAALWYLTGWQQAPGALLIGSVALAFFGGADEAGAAVAQFARFAAIATGAATVLCYILLPLASDYGSFLIVMALFMMPIAAWSVSNPLALLLLAFALSTINLQGEYQPLEFGTFLEASFASLLGIYVGFFWLHMARRMGASHAVERFTKMARADVRALTRKATARDRDLYVARALDRIGALTARLQAAGEPDESVRLLRRLRAGANIADLRHAADGLTGETRQAVDHLLETVRADIGRGAPSARLLAHIDGALSMALRSAAGDDNPLVRGLIGLRLALFRQSPPWSPAG